MGLIWQLTHSVLCLYEMSRSSGAERALKAIDKSKCKGKEQMIENEVSILRRVQHPNIIQLIEEFDFPSELYLIMELVKVMWTGCCWSLVRS